MKGILSYLEKAGLVKNDEPALQAPTTSDEATPAREVRAQFTATPSVSPVTAAHDDTPLKLDGIYASEGVGASVYPAERLLRLVDGLSAMDEATRLMAIKAMDAADECWTIDDPLADASAKVKAISAHAVRLAHNLEQLESETQARLQAASLHQAQVVGDIRKQIAELEGLASRELARAAQETAAHEASLQAARDQTAGELAKITQTSRRLQSLSSQFGSLVNHNITEA